MCTGLEIAGIAMVGSSVYQGYKAKQSADRQGAIDDMNAKLAEELAVDAVRRAELEVGNVREQGARIKAQQRLAYASGNVDVSAGTAAEAVADTELVLQHQADMARLEGARAAYGYRSQGLQYQAVAEAKRAGGEDMLLAGFLNAGSSVLALGVGANYQGKGKA